MLFGVFRQITMNVKVVGVDIAKRYFQVHGISASVWLRSGEDFALWSAIITLSERIPHLLVVAALRRALATR